MSTLIKSDDDTNIFEIGPGIGALTDQLVKKKFKNIKLELIEPLDHESPVNSFLSKNPLGGLHHLGLEVNNIDETYDIAQNLELNPIGKPSEGYHGKLLFFLHPKKMMNTLIEIISKH